MKTLLLATLFAFASCGPYHEPPSPNAPDADGDGIPDVADLCPESAETQNGYRDDDGCPDSSTAHGEMPASVFGGWTGTLTFAVVGTTIAASTHHTLSITPAEDSKALLTGVCPNGTGTATLAWVDGAASWYGIVLCPDTSMGGCITSDVAVYGVRMRVEPDGVLRMNGTGSMRSKPSVDSSCAVSGELSMTFTGTRQ